MNERTHLDCYTGLAGFALAAKANGVRTVGMCECEAFLREGLERIWKVPVAPDIRKFDAKPFRGVWLYTAGTPCQPASRAGKQRGASDDRWLWPETLRVLQESEPTWFIGENPPGILDVGLDGIIAQVEGLGYEVQTFRIPACAVDSPQDRDRVWIVGHRVGSGLEKCISQPGDNGQKLPAIERAVESGAVADSHGYGHHPAQTHAAQPGGNGGEDGIFERTLSSCTLADMHKQRERESDAQGSTVARQDSRLCPARDAWSDHDWIEFNHALYRTPTGIYRMADGLCARIPKRFHSKFIAALGNAICWPVAAEIIRGMIESEFPSCQHAPDVRNK